MRIERWCPVHKRYETQQEWMACDDKLHAQGFRNVGGVPMKIEEPKRCPECSYRHGAHKSTCSKVRGVDG